MKKLLVTGLLCGLMISAAGCGEKAAEAGTGVVMEKVSEGGNDSGSTSGETKAEEKTESANSENTATENAGTADAGAKNAGSEEVPEDLYEAFKLGKAKAIYRGTGDMASYLEVSKALEKGEAYTIDEIGKAVERPDENMQFNSTIDFTTIDCGQDGAPELLVEAGFGDEFSLLMIIKQIDDELVICFDQDTWSRSYVEVKPDGTIEGSGSNGANAHVVDYAYVDHNGDYKYYYGLEETLTLFGDIYAYTKGTDYKTISSEGLDGDHLGIRDFYFEADYDKREHYYNYFVLDDNYDDVTTDADYDDSNELKKRFTEAGIKTYTKAEMDKMIKDRAAEIGYPIG